MIDWREVNQVLRLPIAQDWAKPFRLRVATAHGSQIKVEATRATIEAITRKLREKKWLRYHTSVSKCDGRSESRYYRSPSKFKYTIRISNHIHPSGHYNGSKDYIIDIVGMEQYNVLGYIALIERDERDFRQRQLDVDILFGF